MISRFQRAEMHINDILGGTSGPDPKPFKVNIDFNSLWIRSLVGKKDFARTLKKLQLKLLAGTQE